MLILIKSDHLSGGVHQSLSFLISILQLRHSQIKIIMRIVIMLKDLLKSYVLYELSSEPTMKLYEFCYFK